MRHRKSFNHLSRKKGHRKAMLANMASSLIIHKRIKTTTAKAKALRMFVEPLITKSKNDSTHTRRVVFSHLQNKEAVSELFREVSPKIIDRPGGYTRILKTGFRLGDNADMCIIELVDYNENLLAAKSEAATKMGRKRRRGAKKKAIEDVQVAEAPLSTKEEPAGEVEPEDLKTVIDEKPEDQKKPSPEEKVETKAEDVKKETAEEISDKEEEQQAKDEKQEEKEEEQQVKDEKQEEKDKGQKEKTE
jgi:large subunit ribosomal protein L17